MILQLNYFGMVAEAIKKEKEEYSFSEKTIADLNELLKKEYPKLNQLNYNFAVNQTMVKNDKKLNNNDEIALLPPFAGG